LIEPAQSSWATVCQNCGAALDGKFCPRCGQRAVPPRPTLRELAGDAWQELVGWDGKLARTFRVLLTQPGELTVAVLEGRRARYISPVRVYLLCSLLYFLVAATAPLPRLDLSEGGFDAGVGIGAPENDAFDAVLAKAIAGGVESLNDEERALVDAEIEKRPVFFRPVMRNLVTDYPGFERRIRETLSRALFVLIPVLALVIGLFYRGRHYPEHLYTALHLQSFAFLALCIVVLPYYMQSLLTFSIATPIALILIVAYTVVAQRRVYGGSWLASVVKVLCIGALYVALWAATSFAVTLWVAHG
jgi:hypothetical protein